MTTKISEWEFQLKLKGALAHNWERALTVFQNCGPNLSENVMSALLHAVKQSDDKVSAVLRILEEHYESYLRFQKIEVRGMVSSRLLGINPTNGVFLHIDRAILGLKPSWLE